MSCWRLDMDFELQEGVGCSDWRWTLLIWAQAYSSYLCIFWGLPSTLYPALLNQVSRLCTFWEIVWPKSWLIISVCLLQVEKDNYLNFLWIFGLFLREILHLGLDNVEVTVPLDVSNSDWGVDGMVVEHDPLANRRCGESVANFWSGSARRTSNDVGKFPGDPDKGCSLASQWPDHFELVEWHWWC